MPSTQGLLVIFQPRSWWRSSVVWPWTHRRIIIRERHGRQAIRKKAQRAGTVGLTLPALLTSLGSQIGPGPGQSELPPRVLDDPQERGIDLGVVAKAFGKSHLPYGFDFIASDMALLACRTAVTASLVSTSLPSRLKRGQSRRRRGCHGRVLERGGCWVGVAV